MKAKPFVAVLMGGTSSEREVSLMTGRACADGLEAAGYRVARVDVQDDIAETLIALKPEVAFNALHGTGGEDGVIQGLLELLRIPYTHSGVLASALAMHKINAKHVAATAGIPVAEHRIARSADVAKAHLMEPPYVVKPVSEGSSVGVLIVHEGDAPPAIADESHAIDYMVERFVPGREMTCAVLDGKALGVTEIIADDHEFYDFDAKYKAGGSRHICPAPIPEELKERIFDLSEKAHAVLGCRGASRSDFRYDEATGTLIWLEVNTQPGMTPTSLLPEIAQEAGIPFNELVSIMVEDASLNR